MAKSDDAKRIRRIAELLLDNDPREENEPREPGTWDATMSPHFYRMDEDPNRRDWPGSEPDMRRRAPKLGPKGRDLARVLGHGNRRSV